MFLTTAFQCIPKGIRKAANNISSSLLRKPPQTRAHCFRYTRQHLIACPGGRSSVVACQPSTELSMRLVLKPKLVQNFRPLHTFNISELGIVDGCKLSPLTLATFIKRPLDVHILSQNSSLIAQLQHCTTWGRRHMYTFTHLVWVAQHRLLRFECPRAASLLASLRFA